MMGGEPERFTRDLLDEIRARISISSVAGRRVKLRRAGRGYMGLCPFHQEKSASFSVNDDKGFYHCFGCGAHGDVIEFVMATEGVDFRGAVAALADQGALAVPKRTDPPPPDTARKRDQAHDLVSSTTVGRWLWRTSVPARGELVEAYLAARGLDPHGIPGALESLRFHPRAPYTAWAAHAEPGTSWLTLPAMIAGARDADGHVRMVHATYLAPDGRGKAAIPRAKDGSARPGRKMWGPLTGHGVWLSGSPTGARDGKLLDGEGIETVWAVAQALIASGQRIRAACALSLDNLQGFAAKDTHDAIALWNPQIDPARPCFTIADAGEVVILVDADMKPQERFVQDRRGARRAKRMLSGLERADLCAALAIQQWRRAGAVKVSAVRPKMGMDFNDAAIVAAREAA